jgi:DNA-binding HxlR family transcriptional regulator
VRLEHINVPAQTPSRDHSDCRGVASVLARVGDKWSVFVIMMLIDGPQRFNEAFAHLPEIEGARTRYDARNDKG